MLIDETKRRQLELKKHILEMANSCFDESEVRKMALNLKILYTSNFRHSYSDFFPLILEIAKDDNSYSLDYLSNNMEALRVFVEEDYVSGEKEFKGLYPPLSKLSDHLNLEIGRYSYYSTNEQKVSDLEKRNKTLQSDLTRATNELIDAKNKASSMQTELIAVLSIFAAIVITFSGSLSFIGNALSGMSKTPVFKSAFFVILCGLVLFNAIFLLMYIVGKITGRNIYARCKTVDCSCGEGGNPNCCGISRLRKRLPYIFWFNLVLLLLIFLDIALWILNSLHPFIVV